MAHMKLYTVVAANDALAAQLFAFSDAMVASSWWQKVGADYGVGTATSTHITGPAITSNMSSSDMTGYINDAAFSAGAPLPDASTFYLLYLPSGIDVLESSLNLPNTNCAFFSGYHDNYDLIAGWGWVQRCPSGLSELDELTVSASHEVMEGATDSTFDGYTLGTPPASAPWNANVWLSTVSSGNVEVADVAKGTLYSEGGYTYQRIWSITAAAAGGDPNLPALSNP